MKELYFQHDNHKNTDQKRRAVSHRAGSSGSARRGCEYPPLIPTSGVAVKGDCISTCRCLAVPPVKVPGVDAWFQRASDRVGPSLDVGLKEISIQLSHSIHTYLWSQAHNCYHGDKSSFSLGCLRLFFVKQMKAEKKDHSERHSHSGSEDDCIHVKKQW